MKKFLKLFFSSILVLGLVLAVGCKTPPVEDGDEPIVETVKTLTFDEMADVTIEQYSAFNVKKGMRVESDKGVVYNHLVVVTSPTGTIDATGNLDTNSPGTFVLNYSITIGSVTASATRTVIITERELPTGNLIPFTDFTDQATLAKWELYTDNEGCTYSLENGWMVLDVTAVSSNSYGNRLNNDERADNGISLIKGQSYRLSFFAKADYARTIKIQIGLMYDGAPYWADFGAGLVKNFDITTESYLYTYDFVMGGETTDIANLTLECGSVGSDTPAGKVYFKDLSITIFTGEIEDETAPVFAGVANKTIFVGEGTYDPMTGVTATDDLDGEVTESVQVTVKKDGNIVDSIPLNTPGVYEVTYFVADEAGNERTETVSITIRERSTGVENITNGSEDDCVTNGGWIEWHDQGWVGPTVTIETATVGNGKVTIAYSGNTAVFYGVQLFYNDPAIGTGSKTVKANIKSSVQGSITINGVVVPLQVGDNTIDIEATVGKTSLSIQFGEAGSPDVPVQAGSFEITNLIIGDVTVLGESSGESYTLTNGNEAAAVANPFTIYEWHDQNWCGSTVTINEALFVNGKIVLSYNATGSCWYGMQLFFDDSTVAVGQTKEITLNIKSDVAGKITVSGTVIDLQVGDNKVTVTATKTNALLSIQFGVLDDSSMITAANVEISCDMFADAIAPAPAPEKPVELPDLSEAGEPVAIANPGKYIYWADTKWCGSIVTVTEPTYLEGKVTIPFTSTGTCAFGLQLFMHTTTYNVGDTYNTTLTLTSTVDVTVTVNGTTVELVANTPKQVTVTNTLANEKATLSIQFPIANNIGGTFTVEGVTYSDATPVVPEEKPEEKPEEIGVKTFVLTDYDYHGVNHIGFNFVVEGLKYNAEFTYEVSYENAGADARIASNGQFGESGFRVIYFMNRDYVAGESNTFTITVKNGEITIAQATVTCVVPE